MQDELPASELRKVRDLLKDCSALVTGAGGSRGTGFFIDERLVLTCAHVTRAQAGERVDVQPFGGDSRKGTILQTAPELDVDLALIETDAVDEAKPQPAVVLDREPLEPDTPCFAVGYPKEELLGRPGLEEMRFRAHPRLDPKQRSTVLIRIEAGGEKITPGLSGGALLNNKTGAVVGLVQYSTDDSGTSGGAAIPIARAADSFPLVRDRVQEPPLSTRSWRDALGAEAWRGLGKPEAWRRRVDLILGGDIQQWHVRVAGEDKAHNVTVHQLPEEVSKALFRWAQRARVKDEEQVRYLGRMLSGAVFPPEIASVLAHEALADELLVRLRMDPKGDDLDLFDVPWELATIRVGEDQYVAAERRLGLVRTVEVPGLATGLTQPRAGIPRVIGIVVQPAKLQKLMPAIMVGNAVVPWAKLDELSKRLAVAVDSGRFQLNALPNPTPVQVSGALEARCPEGARNEIVHYIGFGQMENDEAMLAFTDDQGDLLWREARTVFEWVKKSGARVLVAEFALPDVQRGDCDPIPPRAFIEALGESVNAVLFTRFPVHPRQFQSFNDTLYAELAKGASIETAVQSGRSELSGNQFLRDAAAFGCFSLITGPEAYTRILPEPVASAAPPPVLGVGPEAARRGSAVAGVSSGVGTA